MTFRIDHAIRGVRNGQTLVINEWAGLWDAGERYRIGERVLLFLYPPSKLGLTSPVGGLLGRLQIDDAGQVRLHPEWMPALSEDREMEKVFRGKSSISGGDLARAIQRAVEQ